MSIKTQLKKIKENWLLLVIVLVVLGFLHFGNIGISSLSSAMGFGLEKMAAQEASYSRSGYGIVPQPSYGDFAPDVTDTKITKSSSVTIETATGSFKDSESRLRSIVK